MNDTTILVLIIAGLIIFILTIVATISQMQSDISRINITLNKISSQVGVPDTLTPQLKALILDGKRIKAIKEYRMATGIDLLAAKEYIDSLTIEN